MNARGIPWRFLAMSEMREGDDEGQDA